MGLIGIIVYIIGYIVLPKLEVVVKRKSSSFEIYVELKSRESLQKFTLAVRQLGLKIISIELNPAYANSGLAVYSVILKVMKKELGNTDHQDIIDAISSLDMVNFIEETL